jgi:CBS-domain-containing membrane protein
MRGPLVIHHVRHRRTLRPRGEISVDAFVDCGGRGESVPFDVCAACTRCYALAVDPTTEGAEVQCAEPPGRAPRRRGDADLVELALRTRASAVAPVDVVVLSPDVPAVEAATFLADGHLAVAAVVDDEGCPLGVVSQADLAGAQIEQGLFVGDLLRPTTSTVLEDTPLVHALPALLEARGEAVTPVVKASGELLSVLTAKDVVRWLALRAGFEV